MNSLVAQRDMNVRITPPMVMRMELLILQELQWAMRSVTAFCFLNHYYPYFKKFCGFKRRSINEIIVQAQGGKQNFLCINDFILQAHYNLLFLCFVQQSCLENIY